ncbi:Retrovirus-related Pol polyprotein from transposon 17,6 [Rhizoctonia solani]|uniref:Retrovirus-related Pol polyprotein from transposon 17,6 n=1 Tax=Rhizoctonia solani TaxID=456999 RepID=A0A0K6G6X1_9AGAM|nr:Retrovirus-related Pol polyprotein from transposon 17,6 [Rhizoctonia solani]
MVHQQRPRKKNGQFAPYSSPTASSIARDRHAVTSPTPSPTPSTRKLTPRSPTTCHTPLPGHYTNSPTWSANPSPLSVSSPLLVESPVLIGDDIPSDLEDALDQTQSTLRPNVSFSVEDPDLGIKLLADPEPKVVYLPAASPFGSQSPLKLGAVTPLPPTTPTGLAPSSLGKAAASAMVASSSETAAKATTIKALSSIGRFDNDERPMKEAEYRHMFLFATSGCTDEDIAQLWEANLKFEGAAFYWYSQLVSTPEGKAAAAKWSTLKDKVEEQWNTPPIDLTAYRQNMRLEWDGHTFDIESMLDKLTDPGAMVKPHLAWANRHLALGRRVNSTPEDCVSKTLSNLPRYIINMLPNTDQYVDDFKQLMIDLGALLSSSIVNAYLTHTTIDAIKRFQLEESCSSITPARQTSRGSAYPPKTRYQPAQPQVQAAPTQKLAPRFMLPPTIIGRPTSVPPSQLQSSEAAALRLRQQSAPPAPTRDPPPHFKLEQSPPRLCMSSTKPAERLIMDSREARNQQQELEAEWLERNPRGSGPMSDPFPLSPGTYEQTAELCVKCAVGNHFTTLCKAPNPVSEPKRIYRAKLAKQLRGPRRDSSRGRSTGPAPFEGYLVDYDNEDSDPKADIGVEAGDARQWPMKIGVYLFDNDRRTTSKRVWGTIDGGAMLLQPSNVVCRMANGTRVASMGTARAEIEYQNYRWEIEFEVLDSRGAFKLLIGKDWLNRTGAKQDFLTDTLSLYSSGQLIYIDNENPDRPPVLFHPVEPVLQPKPKSEPEPEPKPKPKPKPAHIPKSEPKPKPEPKPETEPEPEPVPRRVPQVEMPEPEGAEEEAVENNYQDSEPKKRVSQRLLERRRREERRARNPFWVSDEGVMALERITGMELRMDNEETVQTLEESWCKAGREEEEQRQRDILLAEPERPTQFEPTDHLGETLRRAKRARERAQGPIDLMALEDTSNKPAHKPIPQPQLPESRRTTDPFNPGRVAEIMSKVKIGEGLSAEQKTEVQGLLREFSDIFALNLSEVLPVALTELKLDIPPDAKFPKKVAQKRLSEPQRKALYDMLDELERAHIVQRVTQDQVAAVSPINLVPKPGGASLPTIKLLQQKANSECRKYGIPIKHPEAGFYEEPEEVNPIEIPAAKWRLVQNFAAVNRFTQVRPFPMGDLLAKQQAVAGHKYISVVDLHAGFHAIPVAPESVPYTGFHVDGRGYYVYLRMPFGLTSAPTTFCEMVAKALHDLIGDGLELWMDDIAIASHDFETGLVRLRRFFERCRTHKISLSAGKSSFFMEEAKFAGARVSEEGIRADLSKVQSILEWPEPRSVLEMMRFIGLANAYRPKIRDFGRMAQPLTDYTRDIPKPDGRAGYKKTLNDTKIELNEAEKKAFAELKVALTSNPVLKPPVYDGRPFIVTTDGSKTGFGAVVSQAWEEVDGKGVTHKVMYPIAFASKRTSRTQEKYPPFLLEFAALKFACDEFDSIIYGQPIEIETDCKALADLLGNEKLNSTHERWRESIVARHIVAVRHKPGIENNVCDALSRMYESRPEDEGSPGRRTDVGPGWESAHDLVNDLYLLTSDTTSQSLLDRYGQDDYFRDIVFHLLYEVGSEPKDEDEARDWKRRAHRAEGYMVQDDKLWLVGGKHSRGGTPVECIPSHEGLELAHAVHSAGGHFGRDMTVLALQQEYHWPRMRRDATEAVTSCAKCRNFGPRLLTALLQPITRARPLDLLVGDYVSYSEGHGGHKNVLLIMDVYSRFTFAFPTRKPGTGRFTVEALNKIAEFVGTPSSFMADGGSHFDCEEVKQWARERGVQVIKTPAYAPWVNGLAEGGVKLLSGRLRTLCAPSIGTSRDGEADPGATPRSWPKHLARAVAQLNDRVLPSLGYSPRELLTGMVSAERQARIGQSIRSPNAPMTEVDVNLALTYALRDDAFANALDHANRRKRAFDKKARVASYEAGDLVQKYDARPDETHQAIRKLAPRWSGALRIAGKFRNSYRLEDLDGNLFAPAAHARLLRPYVPRAGTALADYAEKLRQARRESQPPPVSRNLPKSPRPEERVPLEREDATQPNKYQEEDSEDEFS